MEKREENWEASSRAIHKSSKFRRDMVEVPEIVYRKSWGDPGWARITKQTSMSCTPDGLVVMYLSTKLSYVKWPRSKSSVINAHCMVGSTRSNQWFTGAALPNKNFEIKKKNKKNTKIDTNE